MKERLDHLRSLNYEPSNFPNVSMYYGDGEKAICVERFGSAFISEGRIDIYCPQPQDRIIHYDLDILEETEIYNDTGRPIYVNLEECSLIPEISGDRKITIKNGVMPEDEIQKITLDN
tara:strand:- start:82 stop:435 length:354 start_codon:yes stop_codon:yes gene_type:complete